MERDSPHIDAPVWPWSVVGWLLVAITLLMFVGAWLRSYDEHMLALGMVVLALVMFGALVGFVRLCERI